MAVATPQSEMDGITWRDHDFVHTGPGTIGGRYMRMFWHPVARSEDVRLGHSKPMRIMSEDFTLYRGETGLAHALAFRCAHRGTQLSTGWVEGDEIRCFYHGWKYAASGQCVEQPAEPDPFCERIHIRSYPTEEYLGLIFVYMGEGQAPKLMRFEEFEDPDAGVRETYTYQWPCNYFNGLENDPFHGFFVHRESYASAGRASMHQVRCEETDYGYVTYRTDPQGKTTMSHEYMPNATHARRTAPDLKEGWRGAVGWRVPIDDEHFLRLGINYTHVSGEARDRYLAQQDRAREVTDRLTSSTALAEAVLRGETRIDDIEDRYRDQHWLFELQDYVSQVGQGAIADRDHEHLGREDVTNIMLRSLWTRELRALAEGRPLKEWKRPDRVSTGHTDPW